MTLEEVEDYKSLNKEVFIIKIDDTFYYLRSKGSMDYLNNFFIRSNIIPYTFEVVSNLGEINCLFKHRYSSRISNFHGGDKNHSFINVRSVEFSSYEARAYYEDRFNNLSKLMYCSSNIYPYYKDFFKPVYDFNKDKTVVLFKSINIDLGDYGVENYYPKSNPNIDSQNQKKEPNKYLFLNTKDVTENSFSFSELFTLSEIEKIDKFQVKQYDLMEVLKKEDERLKNVKLVKLDGGGLEPYEDFYGNKYNNYETLIGNGTIANLIEIQKDKVLVKIYRTKCDSSSFCDQLEPGKLYYIPINKVLKYLNTNDLKNEKEIFSFQFN